MNWTESEPPKEMIHKEHFLNVTFKKWPLKSVKETQSELGSDLTQGREI
jgi:hypothetical protein